MKKSRNKSRIKIKTNKSSNHNKAMNKVRAKAFLVVHNQMKTINKIIKICLKQINWYRKCSCVLVKIKIKNSFNKKN